jgi:hypothetical protein
LSSSVFTPLCFLFPCYSLQFFNNIICIHVDVNSITSKTCTTSNNKHNMLSMITLFFCPWTSRPSHSFFYMPFVF